MQKIQLKIPVVLIVIFYLIIGCAPQKKPIAKQPAKSTKPTTTVIKPTVVVSKTEEKFSAQLPEVPREFRAAWVATVANINWPSKNTLSTQEQKAEAIRLLDMLKEANFNAVIFQARPAADALYKSDLEPWSYYLTGTIGKAPSPYYDPLEFWISEAHKKGMELHVWLNPYRAHHTTNGPITSASMVRKMPEQIIKLKNGMYWMDPSDQKTQDHVSNVIKDIVKRYDVDAIHIDDYFYPYREYNGGQDFPDNKTWNAYKNSGGDLNRADWRRANVNKFIKRIHDEIKQENSSVKFGISPFGIWKPGYPAGIKGSSQYDELYADAKLWLNEGWLDYFSPQLYWKTEGPQSFTALLKWWESENTRGKHLWPGLNTVGLRDVADRPSEIVGQINASRNILKKSSGTVHYSTDGLSKNAAMYAAVKNTYKIPALIPKTPWIKAKTLNTPVLTIDKSAATITTKWNSVDEANVFQWILYTQYGSNWDFEILEKSTKNTTLPMMKNGKKLGAVAIKSVDRLGNESNYDGKKL